MKRIFFYFSALFLIGLSLWTHRFFGRVTVDQALWTLSFGTKGVLAADSVYLKRFITWAIFWPSILSFIFVITERFLRIRYLPLMLLMGGMSWVAYQYQLPKYLLQSKKSDKDYFQLNYTDASKIGFTAKNKKSLILIYVESLEATYSQPEIFGHDLLSKLTRLQKNQLVFSSFQQVTGTGWTIGGMVATQCAVPLKSITIMGNNRVGENVSYFLPRVKCLGDILSDLGYQNIFMEGSSLLVGGKGKFLLNHHYKEVTGLDEWLTTGYQESDMNWWGLPDDELLKQARIKFDELMKSDQPFNFTILTVDTHGVSGQLNKTCKQRGASDFQGILECSGEMVAEFVEYMIQHQALKRANIVVMGDHLVMSNGLNDKLFASAQRSIFNVIISEDKFQKRSDVITHFDFLPTILDTLGIHYLGDKLGLGISAIRQSANRFSANHIAEVERQVSHESDFYNQLWMPDEVHSLS